MVGCRDRGEGRWHSQRAHVLDPNRRVGHGQRSPSEPRAHALAPSCACLLQMSCRASWRRGSKCTRHCFLCKSHELQIKELGW